MGSSWALLNTYNMNITINKGSTDVIVDIKDFINLLKDKLVALELVTYVDFTSSIIETQNTIIYLEEYLLSLHDEDDDDYPCDIINEF